MPRLTTFLPLEHPLMVETPAGQRVLLAWGLSGGIRRGRLLGWVIELAGGVPRWVPAETITLPSPVRLGPVGVPGQSDADRRKAERAIRGASGTTKLDA